MSFSGSGLQNLAPETPGLTGVLVSDLLFIGYLTFLSYFFYTFFPTAKTLLETSNLLVLNLKQFWASPVCND